MHLPESPDVLRKRVQSAIRRAAKGAQRQRGERTFSERAWKRAAQGITGVPCLYREKDKRWSVAQIRQGVRYRATSNDVQYIIEQWGKITSGDMNRALRVLIERKLV